MAEEDEDSGPSVPGALDDIDEETLFGAEHLHSVEIPFKDLAEPSLDIALWFVKEHGGMWTKNVNIQFTSQGVMAYDLDNERNSRFFHMSTIIDSQHIVGDEDFGDMFCFITRHKRSHIVHLFQVNHTPWHAPSSHRGSPTKKKRRSSPSSFQVRHC